MPKTRRPRLGPRGPIEPDILAGGRTARYGCAVVGVFAFVLIFISPVLAALVVVLWLLGLFFASILPD